MRYGTQPSSASYPPKASSTSHPVILSMISRWLPPQAAQSSSVRHWCKKINNGLSAYGSGFQVSDLQQLGQNQESVRTKVCLENPIFVHTMSMLPSSCKSLAQGRIHGTHLTTSPVIQETESQWMMQELSCLEERQH